MMSHLRGKREKAINSGIRNSIDSARRQVDESSAAGRVHETPFSLARSLIRKATVGRDLWRIHGGSKFMRQILPWMLHRRYILFEGSLASGLPEFKPHVPEAHIAAAAPSDLPLILKARPGHYSLRQLEDRLKQGHVCFLSRVGSEAVNIRWAFVGSVYLPYLSRTLILASDEFFSDEIFTVPRWRQRGIDQQAFRFMRTWFRERGFETQHCLVTSWDVFLHRRYRANRMTVSGQVHVWPFRASNRVALEGAIRDLGHRTIGIVPLKRET